MNMGTDNIIAQLIAERDKLNRAIEALGGGDGAGIRRRGRPRKNESPVSEAKRRHPRTPAQRKAHSLRMKAYWAKRRSGKA